MQPFYRFVLAHIATGAVGLGTFWIVILSKKGAPKQRRFGPIVYRHLEVGGCFAARKTPTMEAAS